MNEAKLAKILIVNNDQDFCQVLENTLTLEGCNVDSVFYGEDAIKYVKERYYDVAFIDLNLPDLNGMQLLKRFKEINKDIQVIILSEADSSGFAVEAMKTGAFDFITKPIMFDEVLLAIKKAIKQRSRSKAKEDSNQAPSLVGDSRYVKDTVQMIEKVAPTDTTVLIVGESGTGKEVIAQEIFRLSNRTDKPFVKISCAALPETLLESELFGYQKGAFTGASTSKKGLFEVADGGTLFLDEITEVSLGIQAKLLRALQEKEIMPLGGTKAVKVDVRFIAASNKEMHHEINAGRFRQDLYYRLNVIKINTVPLRERREDIPLFCESFMKKYQKQSGVVGKTISKEVMDCFMRFAWPGNIRELENVIERAMILGLGNIISMSDIPDRVRDAYTDDQASGYQRPSVNFDNEVDLELEIANLEKELISKALEKANGIVSRAAKFLKIKRTTLIAKMKKYGIK